MKLPEQLKSIDFLVNRVGVPILVAGFFGYLVFVRFANVDKRMYRILRNQKAIMEKLRVPPPGYDDRK